MREENPLFSNEVLCVCVILQTWQPAVSCGIGPYCSCYALLLGRSLGLSLVLAPVISVAGIYTNHYVRKTQMKNWKFSVGTEENHENQASR